MGSKLSKPKTGEETTKPRVGPEGAFAVGMVGLIVGIGAMFFAGYVLSEANKDNDTPISLPGGTLLGRQDNTVGAPEAVGPLNKNSVWAGTSDGKLKEVRGESATAMQVLGISGTGDLSYVTLPTIPIAPGLPGQQLATLSTGAVGWIYGEAVTVEISDSTEVDNRTGMFAGSMTPSLTLWRSHIDPSLGTTPQRVILHLNGHIVLHAAPVIDTEGSVHFDETKWAPPGWEISSVVGGSGALDHDQPPLHTAAQAQSQSFGSAYGWRINASTPATASSQFFMSLQSSVMMRQTSP